jgi:nucleobase:cation symporter-1, NCS1 family
VPDPEIELWVLLEEFLTYLPALGAVLAPIAGIMVADYYLVRRRRLDVPALFDREGRYRYWRGANPAALIGWLLGATAGLLLLDYSFLVALPIGFGAYLVLMRSWVQPRMGGGEDDTHASASLGTSAGRDWPVTMEGGDM